MNQQMQIIVNQMIIFAVLLGIGAVAAKTNVLSTIVLDSLAKIGRLKGNTSDVHTAETTFGNVGFMGIPLLLALFGEKGMIYISIAKTHLHVFSQRAAPNY